MRIRKTINMLVVIATLLFSLVVVGIASADTGTTEPSSGKIIKGLAMAVRSYTDMETLGVDTYLQWGWCSTKNCVPMMRYNMTPYKCAPVIIAGNEPNAVEPFGRPYAPWDYAEKLISAQQMCPNTTFVAGNPSYDNWGRLGRYGAYRGDGVKWLSEFLQAYEIIAGHPFDQIIGVHCYLGPDNDASYCNTAFSRYRELYDGEMWVTEFGSLTGDPTDMQRMLETIEALDYAAAFVYTNRQPHRGYGWELARTVDLIDAQGRLTPVGEVYANWRP